MIKLKVLPVVRKLIHRKYFVLKSVCVYGALIICAYTNSLIHCEVFVYAHAADMRVPFKSWLA